MQLSLFIYRLSGCPSTCKDPQKWQAPAMCCSISCSESFCKAGKGASPEERALLCAAPDSCWVRSPARNSAQSIQAAGPLPSWEEGQSRRRHAPRDTPPGTRPPGTHPQGHAPPRDTPPGTCPASCCPHGTHCCSCPRHLTDF